MEFNIYWLPGEKVQRATGRWQTNKSLGSGQGSLHLWEFASAPSIGQDHRIQQWVAPLTISKARTDQSRQGSPFQRANQTNCRTVLTAEDPENTIGRRVCLYPSFPAAWNLSPACHTQPDIIWGGQGEEREPQKTALDWKDTERLITHQTLRQYTLAGLTCLLSSGVGTCGKYQDS